MPDTNTAQTQASRPYKRWLTWLVGLCVLFVVFMQYRDPHFLVGVADQLWSCF